MGKFDAGNRTKRVLNNTKSRAPTVADGIPDAFEGKNGDATYRRVGNGIVMYVKDGDNWNPIGGTTMSATTDPQYATQEAVDGVHLYGPHFQGYVEDVTGPYGTGALITTYMSQTLSSSQNTLIIDGENPMKGTGITNFDVDGSDGAFDGDRMELGTASTGLLGLLSTTKVRNCITDIDDILAKLAPAKPPNLSLLSMISTDGISLSYGGSTYTAKKENTLTSVTPVTESSVTFIVEPNGATSEDPDGFYDGSTGTVAALASADGGASYPINSGSVTLTEEGSSTMTGADDGLTSTNSGLTLEITEDFDPWFGVSGQSNFYESCGCRATIVYSSGDKSNIAKKLKVTHSTTGEVASLGFYYDVASAPTITNMTDANLTARPSEPGDVRERHGVLAFDGGGTFEVSYVVGGICDKFYHNTGIGGSKIQGWNDAYQNDNADSPPTEGNPETLVRSFSRSLSQHSGKAGIGITTFQIVGIARNWKGSVASDSFDLTDVYVDSYADKSNRRNAGKTQYPAYGINGTTQYGGSAFNMDTVLGLTDFFELMQFGNDIQWPNVDFDWINHPTQDQADADINYDSEIGASSGTNIGGSYYRWFCKKFTGVLSTSSGFTIELNGDSGLSGSPHDPNIKIYAIANSGGADLTTWMDCNTDPGYSPGDPNPGTIADGDLCVVNASSDKDTKVCTFGTANYTGDLYIRVGLKDGSDSFTDITISGT